MRRANRAHRLHGGTSPFTRNKPCFMHLPGISRRISQPAQKLRSRRFPLSHSNRNLDFSLGTRSQYLNDSEPRPGHHRGFTAETLPAEQRSVPPFAHNPWPHCSAIELKIENSPQHDRFGILHYPHVLAFVLKSSRTSSLVLTPPPQYRDRYRMSRTLPVGRRTNNPWGRPIPHQSIP